MLKAGGPIIHGLPEVSPRLARPNPATPCGGGPPTDWVACGRLLAPWIPHAVQTESKFVPFIPHFGPLGMDTTEFETCPWLLACHICHVRKPVTRLNLSHD